MSTGPETPPTLTATRMEWMDTVRGASILLVVTYHTIFFTYGTMVDAPPALVAFNAVFAPLRMPLMVFLSGMFVPASLTKGARQYVAGKLRNILHPYLVWSAIMLLLLSGASVVIGREFDPGMVWQVFYRPIDHLWFLVYLLFFYLIALVLSRVNPVVVATVAGLVAFAPVGGTWERFWVLLCCFMLGVGATQHRGMWRRITMHRATPWVTGVAFLIVAALSVKTANLRYAPEILPLVLAAVVGACLLAQSLGSPPGFRWLRFIGRESLIYYVTHWPIVLVAFVVIHKVAPGLPEPALFVLGVIVALAGGTALALSTHRSRHVRWLFRFRPASFTRREARI